jgi:hypothetical protein
MTKNKKENGTTATKTRKPRDPNAPPVKRPRAGCWTPVTRDVPIPGTQDADGKALTTPVEMYTVEFCGETIEVLKNRAGVKIGNNWIKSIKSRGEESLRIHSIRKKLEEMAKTASTADVRDRLMAAVATLHSGSESNEP